MLSLLFKEPLHPYYSRNHLDGILFTMAVALLIKETMVLLLFKESRRCLIIQGTAVALIIQNMMAVPLLFKEILRPYYSRNLCGVQEIAMGLVTLKDHCSVLVIQGIILVFRIFNCGVLIIQATTVSLLITTNYNT